MWREGISREPPSACFGASLASAPRAEFMKALSPKRPPLDIAIEAESHEAGPAGLRNGTNEKIRSNMR